MSDPGYEPDSAVTAVTWGSHPKRTVRVSGVTSFGTTLSKRQGSQAHDLPAEVTILD